MFLALYFTIYLDIWGHKTYIDNFNNDSRGYKSVLMFSTILFRFQVLAEHLLMQKEKSIGICVSKFLCIINHVNGNATNADFILFRKLEIVRLLLVLMFISSEILI